ncbi:hypothetical protein ACFQFQ_10610 [Sulfitobacter porphyrae]|uniref:Uncharacterized protein n=1 Tax=Sulfitobacter porphyrae TaxID=1246864 RepID=A0ABW2B2B9_9RHOB
MKIRQAEIRDVRQMSDFLTRLRELGKRRNPSDADFVRLSTILKTPTGSAAQWQKMPMRRFWVSSR